MFSYRLRDVEEERDNLSYGLEDAELRIREMSEEIESLEKSLADAEEDIADLRQQRDTAAARALLDAAQQLRMVGDQLDASLGPGHGEPWRQAGRHVGAMAYKLTTPGGA